MAVPPSARARRTRQARITIAPKIRGRALGPLRLDSWPTSLDEAHRIAAAYADEEKASGEPASRAGIERAAFLALAQATKHATRLDLHRLDVEARLRRF